MIEKIPFDVSSLQELCDEGAWQRGALLQRRGAVQLLEVTAKGDDDYDDEYDWLIAGLVQGTQRQPYRVSVELALLSDGQVNAFESNCSCPVGFDCKHGIALALEAQQGGRQWQGAGGALIAQLQQQAVQAKEALLLQWLQDLDRANTQARPPAPLQPKERHEQYLYVLSIGEDKPSAAVLRLQAMTSYIKRSGAWAKPKRMAVQPAPGQPAFDHASDAERTLLQLLGALPGWHAASSYYYSSAGNLLIALVDPGYRITDDFQRELCRLAGVPGLFGLGVGRSGRQQGTPGFAADTVDHALDFHRRRLSAQGQCPHFIGDHCKSSP